MKKTSDPKKNFLKVDVLVKNFSAPSGASVFAQDSATSSLELGEKESRCSSFSGKFLLKSLLFSSSRRLSFSLSSGGISLLYHNCVSRRVWLMRVKTSTLFAGKCKLKSLIFSPA